MKKLILISIFALAITGCAHRPLTAPCKAAQVASLHGDCVSKPINTASLNFEDLGS